MYDKKKQSARGTFSDAPHTFNKVIFFQNLSLFHGTHASRHFIAHISATVTQHTNSEQRCLQVSCAYLLLPKPDSKHAQYGSHFTYAPKQGSRLTAPISITLVFVQHLFINNSYAEIDKNLSKGSVNRSI
jgi:hypothetical protein